METFSEAPLLTSSFPSQSTLEMSIGGSKDKPRSVTFKLESSGLLSAVISLSGSALEISSDGATVSSFSFEPPAALFGFSSSLDRVSEGSSDFSSPKMKLIGPLNRKDISKGR